MSVIISASAYSNFTAIQESTLEFGLEHLGVFDNEYVYNLQSL